MCKHICDWCGKEHPATESHTILPVFRSGAQVVCSDECYYKAEALENKGFDSKLVDHPNQKMAKVIAAMSVEEIERLEMYVS